MKKWIKKIIIECDDMFAEYSLQRLITCCLVPAIAVILLGYNIADYFSFANIAHIIMSIVLFILLVWQAITCLGFSASLIARFLCKNWK
jgi:predicted membrane chloride channel (bestrophin family)